MYQVREDEGEVPLSQLDDGSHFGEGALVGDNHRYHDYWSVSSD